jgi:hypothetical protein
VTTLLETPTLDRRRPTVVVPADPSRELAARGRALQRLVDAGARPERWSLASFAREVELVRLHLGPLRSRTMLAASFGRESHHPGLLAGGRAGLAERSLGASAVEVAYAIRWLELGDGRARPTWHEWLVLA